MVYHATEIIAAKFDEMDLKYSIREAGTLSLVELFIGGENVNVKFNFISFDNDNDVKVLTGSFAKFPESKLSVGYKLINDLNKEYKCLKFTIDSDGDVSAQYDFPLRTTDESLSEFAGEMLARFVKSINDCYPKIMKTVWS